jgi:hypothetical protein
MLVSVSISIIYNTPPMHSNRDFVFVPSGEGNACSMRGSMQPYPTRGKIMERISLYVKFEVLTRKTDAALCALRSK